MAISVCGLLLSAGILWLCLHFDIGPGIAVAFAGVSIFCLVFSWRQFIRVRAVRHGLMSDEQSRQLNQRDESVGCVTLGVFLIIVGAADVMSSAPLHGIWWQGVLAIAVGSALALFHGSRLRRGLHGAPGGDHV